MYLKQSTTATVQIGPFLDATDGVTPETALTPGIEVSKAGAAFAARNSATAVSHDAEGFYRVELDGTDTATVGTLIVKAIDSANHVPVWHTFTVLAANVYDSIIGGTDALQVHANEITNNLITAAAINDGAITAAKIDTGAVDADALAADAAVEIAAAVWDRVLTGATHNIASSAGRRLRAIPDTIGGSVDDATPSATEFATSLAGAYSDDHFNDQTIRFTSGAAAGEVAVIVDYVDLTGTITLDEAMANTPGNTDTFEILSTHVHPKSQIADVVLDELLSGHSTAGSLGKAVTDILEDTGTTVPAQISTLSTDVAAVPTVSEIWAGLGDTEKNAIADALLTRGVSNVEDTAGASTLCEMVLAAFESSMPVGSSTWTIKKTDGVTTFNTRTVTTDASAEGITSVT